MSIHKNYDYTGYTNCELELSRLQPGRFQPRRYFDEKALNEMASSIRKSGVLQAIVARPIDENNYEIVAGERRYRAAKIAGLATIPTRIKEMTDSEALLIATEENIQRTNMSTVEESYAANMAVSLCDGDRIAASSVLGWTESKLNSRLFLLNLTNEAQDALLKNEIHIGHAELICTLTADNQNKAITSIIEKKITVQELKARLQEFAYVLSTAIFDTTGCNGCHNNTSNQYELFSESIGTGRCTNTDCWQSKEIARMAEVKQTMQGEYNVVYFDVERLPNSFNYLIEKNVGKEQYNQCVQCKNFGAIISTRAESMSKVDEDICFNPACYTSKMKAFTATMQSDNVAKKTGVKSHKTVISNKAKADEVPKKLLEHRNTLNRHVVLTEILKDGKLQSVMTLVVLAEHTKVDEDSIKAQAEQLISRIGINEVELKLLANARDNIPALYAMSEQQIECLQLYLIAINAAIGKDYGLHMEDRSVTHQLKILNPIMEKHFVITRDYLELHSKKGMLGVLRESGFAEWYDQQHSANKKESFDKLSNKTIKEILDTVFNCRFDFRGYIPSFLMTSESIPSKSGDIKLNHQVSKPQSPECAVQSSV